MNKKRILNRLYGKSQKNNDKLLYDFMPEYMELIERPPHPSARLMILLIMSLLISLLAWASLSKVDVIIPGQGSLIYSQNSRTFTSPRVTQVMEVLAEEGQAVTAGQALVELDKQVALLELDRLKGESASLIAQKEIYQLFQGDMQASLDKEIYQVGQDPALDAILAENAFYQQQSKVTNPSLVLAQYRMVVETKLAEIDRQETSLAIQIEEKNKELATLRIVAPFDGILETVAVEEGQSLSPQDLVVRVAPLGSQLVFEGYLSDKDRASVQVGMPMKIKLQAYSYQKYGTIEGSLSYISPIATPLDSGASVYRFTANLMIGPDSDFPDLSQGMTGVAEMKVRERSILDYFLDPITKSFQSTLTEE